MKLILLLVSVSCVLAQPQVDSVFVFENESGYFTHAYALPDSGYILGGITFGNRISWRVARMSAEREIIWSHSVPSIYETAFQDIVVTDDAVLVVGRLAVPIDSNSSTLEPIIVKYSLDGDSLWSRNFHDPVNYTQLSSACPSGDGGYFVLGSAAVLSNEVYNYEIKLARVDSDGAMLWERFFGGELTDQGGKIVKLAGDSVLFTALMRLGTSSHIAFIWANLDGDSLGGRIFGAIGSTSAYQEQHLYERNNGWEFVWHDVLGSPIDGDLFRWIRTDYWGNPIFETAIVGPINSLQGFGQSDDGLMTVGFSPWGDLNGRDIVVGRVNPSAGWLYSEAVLLPWIQEAYGFLPTETAGLALLGRSDFSDTTSMQNCIFYLGDSELSTFLYAMPPRLEFGVVELDQTEVVDVELSITGDSSIVVTDIELPEECATNLGLPAIVTGDAPLSFRIAFQPNELRQYRDTIRVASNALNGVLNIPMTGAAPYPECEPALRTVEFHWTHVGDSVRRPLAIRNTGTIPLHIDEIVEPAPFYLDSLGVFVVEPGFEAVLWFEFWPDSAIPYRRSMVLQSDDPQSPDTVILTGRGVGNITGTEDVPLLPREFSIHPAYPNPFNPTTTIGFELPAARDVRVELFDVTGRRVKEISGGMMTAGSHTIEIDLREFASGIYFVSFTAGEWRGVQKLLLVK